MSSRRPAPTRVRCLAFCALALSSGCFDPPVRQILHLELHADGSAEVSATVELRSLDEETNPAVARRLGELRESLVSGWDEWSRHFEDLAAASEELLIRHEEEVLVSVRRSAVVEDARQLEQFFAGLGADLFVSHEGSATELLIYPGGASRATRRQRRMVDEALSRWSGAIADYVRAVEDLWTYLARRPERATATIAKVLGDVVSSEVLEAAGAVDEEGEMMLVAGLKDAMEEVWQVLLVPEGEAYSLDELAQLVYDPFPSAITVGLPAAAIEVDGFERGEDRTFEIRRLGLWSALRSLRGTWVAPDPLLLHVEHTRAERELDLAAVLAVSRFARSGLTASEVQKAIEDRLRPEDLYRLVW